MDSILCLLRKEGLVDSNNNIGRWENDVVTFQAYPALGLEMATGTDEENLQVLVDKAVTIRDAIVSLAQACGLA